ncbi:Homolog of Odr-2 (Two) [Caenorhabditis elegans]|uniref:Homolog of Odr-2 (Two) n=2 Tax=Caenorhabditis elegans TaxID=6239 RepID=Q8T3B0_CAEEL|nr:Homolog of Odr-2 (Two) [Caenorhabditis elegans]CAD27610.1 Homolog of Odr-2 (Two) [Caenorhabditis elegans]|eukprot:NP_741057.1 Homolog of Odr-2 (Two) [Caenorhabditis elegans]
MTFSTIFQSSFITRPQFLRMVIISSLISTICSSAVGYRHANHSPNRCFSCMSQMYEGFMSNGLDRYFNRPRNFSSQCDGEMDVTNMHTVPCRTICLTIQQNLVVMGQPTGHRLYMRGCALTIARRGLNNHTLSMFDRYDICRDMSASDLFSHEHADSQRIRVCSCLGDRCNSAISTSNCQSLSVLAILVALSSLLF